jgi:hypothetical protein
MDTPKRVLPLRDHTHREGPAACSTARRPGDSNRASATRRRCDVTLRLTPDSAKSRHHQYCLGRATTNIVSTAISRHHQHRLGSVVNSGAWCVFLRPAIWLDERVTCLTSSERLYMVELDVCSFLQPRHLVRSRLRGMHDSFSI